MAWIPPAMRDRFWVGLVVGGLLGWAAATLLTAGDGRPLPTEPSSDRRARADEAGGSAALPELAPQSAAQAPVATFRKEPEISIGAADAQAIERFAKNASRPFPEDTMRALVARLRDAVARGDRALAVAVIEALGLADRAEADDALVELMGNVALPLPHPFGGHFAKALEDSRATGVAEAARRRVDALIAGGEKSWTSGLGWFDLVARHGSRADLEWMLAHEGQLRHQAVEALSKSSSPQAFDLLQEEVREGRIEVRNLRALAEHSPVKVADLLEDLLAREAYRGELRDMLGTYAQVLPIDRVDEAKALLRRLPDPRGFSAVYAVEVLRRRGIDVSDMTDVMRGPERFLSTFLTPADADAASSRVYAAMYAIEYNRGTWSEDAARALEAAAREIRAHPLPSPSADALEDVAAKVRTGLRNPWK
jgi:hypothetical protein